MSFTRTTYLVYGFTVPYSDVLQYKPPYDAEGVGTPDDVDEANEEIDALLADLGLMNDAAGFKDPSDYVFGHVLASHDLDDQITEDVSVIHPGGRQRKVALVDHLPKELRSLRRAKLGWFKDLHAERAKLRQAQATAFADWLAEQGNTATWRLMFYTLEG